MKSSGRACQKGNPLRGNSAEFTTCFMAEGLPVTGARGARGVTAGFNTGGVPKFGKG